MLEQKNSELESAIERSIRYNLIKSQPGTERPPHLESEAARSDVSKISLPSLNAPVTGLCQIIVSGCIEQIKDRLGCNAWMIFGWLSDMEKPGSFFWRMDPDELCKGLSKGWIGIAEIHAWIMLDSGEIIDPVVYPTLAENFKQFAHGSGRCNILSAEGRPYQPMIGLPFLQYHPLAVLC